MVATAVWTELPAGLRSDPLQRGRYDVVVVGAGIVGLTTALLAARAGMRVAVVEAREPGAGTTGRSTAKATLLQGTTASQILKRHGAEVLRHYVEANRAGLELLRTNLKGSGVPWEERDAWTYAADEAARGSIEAEADALKGAGVPAHVAATDELPFATGGGVRVADQVQLDPRAYVAWLVERVRVAGAQVAWPIRALGVSPGKSGDMVVDCGSMQLTARWVVLATLLPFPLRTLMFAVAAPSRSYAISGWAQRPDQPRGMYLSTGQGPTRSLRTATDAAGREVLLLGGHGHPTGKQLPASGHLQALAEWGEQQFGPPGELHRWSAQDYLSADALPHIGAARRVAPDRLLFACGFSKWGITNGSAAAIALVGMMKGGEPAWATPLRPRVPRVPGRLARINLDVGVELVRGWTRDPRGHGGGLPAEGGGEVLRHLPAPVAVSRIDGRLLACSARCTHIAGIVRWNDVEQSWDCPLHGSRFSPDGQVLEGPAVAALHPRKVPG